MGTGRVGERGQTLFRLPISVSDDVIPHKEEIPKKFKKICGKLSTGRFEYILVDSPVLSLGTPTPLMDVCPSTNKMLLPMCSDGISTFNQLM